MLKSFHVIVDGDPVLLWEAAAITKVTVRAVASNNVKVGDKEITMHSGLTLNANVPVDINMYKGDVLYSISCAGTRCVEVLVQEETL